MSSYREWEYLAQHRLKQNDCYYHQSFWKLYSVSWRQTVLFAVLFLILVKLSFIIRPNFGQLPVQVGIDDSDLLQNYEPRDNYKYSAVQNTRFSQETSEIRHRRVPPALPSPCPRDTVITISHNSWPPRIPERVCVPNASNTCPFNCQQNSVFYNGIYPVWRYEYKGFLVENHTQIHYWIQKKDFVRSDCTCG